MGVGLRVKCKKCGDEIRSTHRHDFVKCKCGAIYVDGGSDYLRLGYPPGERDDALEILHDDLDDNGLLRSGN